VPRYKISVTAYKTDDDRIPQAQKQKTAKVNYKLLSQYHCVAFHIDIDIDVFVNCIGVDSR
jgi:hypothetical protein